MKVADLLGVMLDYWVARAEGADLGPDWDQDEYVIVGGHSGHPQVEYSPSTDWAQGGPIIERERIHLEPFPGGDEYPEWLAFEQSDGWGEPLYDSPLRQYGDTALMAAMRAYVALRFGDEVPDSAIDAPQTAGD